MAQSNGILRSHFRHISGIGSRLTETFSSDIRLILPGRQIAAPDIDMDAIFSGKTAFPTLATSAEVCYIGLEIQKSDVLEGGFILHIRDAAPPDIAQIMDIYAYAQDDMIQSGNPTQWGHFYPEAALIASDIRQNACKVIFDETGIHGVFALFAGVEPTYARIEGGNWLNNAPYLTIHRLAGDGQVHGLFRCTASYCKAIAQNIRIDTHADNKTMQHLIEADGFTRCGIIYIADGTPRIAYQWTAE